MGNTSGGKKNDNFKLSQRCFFILLTPRFAFNTENDNIFTRNIGKCHRALYGHSKNKSYFKQELIGRAKAVSYRRALQAKPSAASHVEACVYSTTSAWRV